MLATLSFTGMVATGTFAFVLSDASPAWAAPKKKKKVKAADTDTTDDSATPAASTDSGDKNTDDLMNDSVKTKSKAQIKADSEAADAPAKETIAEPDAWEKPPAEEEKPK
ncbi:MAG TPA: hypothetical protein VHZ95_20170, partial [Polyangiales bacterium]|nr:hypothetical protein [Polyangiales bacterium]